MKEHIGELRSAPYWRTSQNTPSTTFVNKPSLPYARRRLLGTCQSTPGGGKHYQHYDEHCQYLPYRDNRFQCCSWRHEYPRRPQKEVEYTNNDGGPQAPLLHHP